MLNAQCAISSLALLNLMVQARTFLEQLPLSPADKEQIAHGNAEHLLRL
jgi:predicted TIM-barrel fold metal-dependent hydrolase